MICRKKNGAAMAMEGRKEGKRDEFLDIGIAPRELVEPKVVKKKIKKERKG